MSRYADMYKQGAYDGEKLKPMALPSPLDDAEGYRGYMDGYGCSPYCPPDYSQEILLKNLSKVNFIR